MRHNNNVQKKKKKTSKSNKTCIQAHVYLNFYIIRKDFFPQWQRYAFICETKE